jgi:hypothetical protein
LSRQVPRTSRSRTWPDVSSRRDARGPGRPCAGVGRASLGPETGSRGRRGYVWTNQWSLRPGG